MNTKLVLVLALVALMVTASVLTHDIEAKKKKKCGKAYEDGSKGNCVGDKVKWWSFKVVNGQRVITGEHTCIVKYPNAPHDKCTGE